MIILKYKYGKIPVDELDNMYNSIRNACPEEKILMIPDNLQYIEGDLEYLCYLRGQICDLIEETIQKTYK